MAKIKAIRAREILDSRGVPTIEGYLLLDNNKATTAQAASGESLGKHEGVELRDGDMERYHGKGVLRAISYINDLIAPRLVGVDIERFADIDYWLATIDPTPDVSSLGVNTLMTISQLVHKAYAKAVWVPLYIHFNTLFNKRHPQKILLERVPGAIYTMINGGKHGSRNLEFQEFHVLPSTSVSFANGLVMAAVIYETLENVLHYRNAEVTRSVEGGFAPNLLTNTDALEIIRETVSQSRLKLGIDIYMGLDIAASHFFEDGKYKIRDKSQPAKTDEYMEFLMNINREYDILFLEDPFDQDDFDAWKKINEKLGSRSYITGDDFLAGKKDRIVKAAREKACTTVLLKFNQNPTIMQLVEVVSVIRESGLKAVFSHRLGETNDSIIADLAVGLQTDFVKFGPPVGGERVAKYNRLLTIEAELGTKK